MAIKITLKNSVVQDSVPTTSHLAAVGELALNANINSLGIYMRASDNSIVKMAGPGSVTTPAASTTAAGIAELATSAETTTGTDTARVCTPAGVKAVTDAERTTSNNTYLALAGGTLTGVVAATAGSNSAPAIHFGDSDSGIYGGTNTVSLAAGGTQGLTLNSSAYVNVPTRLGIGVAAPAVPLHVIGEARIDPASGTSTIRFSVGGTEKGKLAVDSSSNLFFETAGTERARIDASGRLLVGLTSARTLNSGYTPSLQVEGNTATTSSISAINNVNQTGGPSVWLGKSRGAALGGVTTVQSGDELGSIFFNGADGTDIQSIGASIVAKSNGTVAGNRMPGELLFATTADSAGSVVPTTRLKITSAGVVNVPDNGKFTVGTGDDLQIYHDATHTYIQNGTNNLYIRATTTETGISVIPNGAVKLFYDNSAKLETINGGISVTGGVNTSAASSFSGNIHFGDNVKANFGASDDLQIYHDSNHTYIDNHTGQLKIRNAAAGNILIQARDDDEGIVVEPDGSVELYYDNSKKLETITTGIKITATEADIQLNSTGPSGVWRILGSTGGNTHRFRIYDATNDREPFYIDNSGDITISGDQHFADNKKVLLGTGSDLQIYHDGNNNLILGSPTVLIKNKDNNESYIRCNENAEVSLYYDNSKKFETLSTGVQVTGDIGFNVTPGSWDSVFKAIEGGGNSKNGSFGFQTNGDWTTFLGCNFYYNAGWKYRHAGGASYMYFKEDKLVFNLAASGSADAAITWSEKFNVDTNGNFNIPNDTSKLQLGTSQDLQIYHDGNNSYLENAGTGSLNLYGDDVGILNKAKSEWKANFISNGGVELYYDNSKKLATNSAGVVVDNGTMRCNDGFSSDTNLILNSDANANGASAIIFKDAGNEKARITGGNIRIANDSGKIQLGTSQDLEIYHNGTNSHLDNSTGSLYVRSNTLFLSSQTDSETYLKGVKDGGVELYYDNTKRLETTSSGTQVSGHFEVNNGELNMTGGPDNKYFDVAHQDHSFFFRRTNASDGNHSTTCTVASNNVWSADFNDTSDEKLKKNIVSIPDGAIANVKQLRPVNFDWKDETAQQGNTGFVAQEVKAILPNLVNGEEWDGTEGKAYSLNTGGVLAHVTKALQEAIAKIEVLETKVAALEGA